MLASPEREEGCPDNSKVVEDGQTEKEVQGKSCKGDLHTSLHQTAYPEETLPEGTESHLGNTNQHQDGL